MKNSIIKGLVALSLLVSMSSTILADTTEDLINALVLKNILTEDEAALLSRQNKGEGKTRSKNVAGKLSISKYLKKATLYGDIRARQEWRQGEEYTTPANAWQRDSVDRSRQRYKITLGVKTVITNDWYTDLAFAMGSKGRSDNATLGGGGYEESKQTLYVKRAMIGWKPTKGIALEAGRIKNPLYTKAMVWDKDLTWDGVSFKTKHNISKQTTFEFKGGVNTMTGDDKQYTNSSSSDNDSQYQLSAQVVGKYKFDKKQGPSLKLGLSHTIYTNDDDGGLVFEPSAVGNGAQTYINDLSLIEIPFDFKTMISPGLGMTIFGDLAYNIDGSDRRQAFIDGGGTGGADDDKAFMIGVGLGSYKNFKALDKGKLKKGDWKGNLWYQEVGTYSVDPNHVDSDIFDSKVNIKGFAFKGQYMIEDNIKANIAYAHGEINDTSVGCTPGVKGDTGLCLDEMDLLQLDVTYKF
tara:strand:+ start:13780 stop:15174 length:1395 start_codon:yes stop_codon:yes gene_type:complete